MSISNISGTARIENEVRYLHDYFFKLAVPHGLIERYAEAVQRCLPEASSAVTTTIDTILAHHLDVEAIEYIFRMRNRNNHLTKRIQVLFYLVEVRSAYFPIFFNCRKAGIFAIWKIITSGLLTPYKLLKGAYLIRRYRLV